MSQRRVKLILSGGGTRGIYQVGALKALEEAGYLADVVSVSGCSIGAINAALWMQYPVDEMNEIWKRFSRLPLFKNVNHNSRLFPLQLLKQTLWNKGLETDTLKQILHTTLDEGKLRATGKEFIISTYNHTRKEAVYFGLDDIPEGELTSHLIASARLPIFKPEIINGDVYLDGGYIDSEPMYSKLEDKTFDLMIRIRTVHMSSYIPNMMVRNIQCRKQMLIMPSGKLGFPLNFKNPTFMERYEMGYGDAIQAMTAG